MNCPGIHHPSIHLVEDALLAGSPTGWSGGACGRERKKKARNTVHQKISI